MSKQLLDKLENKVFSAVDTIELLRSEINDLKEERKTLENKLQELIEKMGNLDNGGLERQLDSPAKSEEQAPTSSMEMDELQDSDWRVPASSMGMEALRESKEQEPTSSMGMDELPDSKEQNSSSAFGPAIQSYKDQNSDY